jgi:tRNA-specific adenosine deaminase 3
MRVVEIYERRHCDPNESNIDVIVASIVPQSASRLIRIISDRLPLADFGLDHARRAHKNESSGNLELLICPVDTFASLASPKLDDIKNELLSNRVVSLLKYAPRTKKELEAGRVNWPLVFKPSELDKEREKGVSGEEVALVVKKIDFANADAHQMKINECLNGSCVSPVGAVMVNPSNGSIVMDSYRGFQSILKCYPELTRDILAANPLYDPVMLCLRGFGLVLAGQIPGMELLPEDQYLCTGLDLYLTEEPGMVSAMALVHSRIRKVFFKSRNIFHGALGSKYMLHTSKALNHRFRVFECVANDAQ